jgi:hypothetical protein
MTIHQALAALRGRLTAWVEFKKVPDTDPEYVKKATELNALITGFNQLENQVKTLTHTVGDLQRKNYALQARLKQADELAQTNWFEKYKALEAQYIELIDLRNGSIWDFVAEVRNKARNKASDISLFNEQLRAESIRKAQETWPALY